MLLLLCLTGCNRQVIDLDYSFDKAICVIGNETKEFELRTLDEHSLKEIMQGEIDATKELIALYQIDTKLSIFLPLK